MVTFAEQLKLLIGHEVIILQVHELLNDDGSLGNLSIIRAVDEGHLITEGQVEKDDEDNPSESLVGTFESVVNIAFITRVIHTMPECSGCLVDSLNGEGQ